MTLSSTRTRDNTSPMYFLPWGIALIAGIVPLWIPRRLPIVDMPQHLHLISVMQRLTDPTTLYPEYFQLRKGFTSYLGYYYSVDALSFVMPLEIANRVFVSLCLLSLPLSVAFLLRTFRRATWPALLTIPLAYGDSLAWGFINSSVSFSFAILTAACFVRTIEDEKRRLRWGVATALLLVLVLTFHVQPFVFLGLALPFLLLTSTAPDGVRAKRGAVLSVLPGVAMFLFWVASRARNPSKVVPPELWNPIENSWDAVGPLLSPQNFVFKGFLKNLKSLIQFPEGWRHPPEFPLLGRFLEGPNEHRVLFAILLLAIAATVLGLVSANSREPRRGGYRLLGLAAISALLYFYLPLDILGHMYKVNIRHATYIAVFLLAAIPDMPKRARRVATWLALACVISFVVPMARAFHAFDAESTDLEAVAKAAPARAKVMGLMYNEYSDLFTHPVFVHAATEIAREKGGVANFSFALTQHSPLQYRREPPPSFPNEWYPQTMDWEKHGSHYDCILLRGDPTADTSNHIDMHLVLRKKMGTFSLYCRPESRKESAPVDSQELAPHK